MHKPRRFLIKCKPNVIFCTMSIWVNSYLFILPYLCLFIFCLPNKLYIYIGLSFNFVMVFFNCITSRVHYITY